MTVAHAFLFRIQPEFDCVGNNDVQSVIIYSTRTDSFVI